MPAPQTIFRPPCPLHFRAEGKIPAMHEGPAAALAAPHRWACCSLRRLSAWDCPSGAASRVLRSPITLRIFSSLLRWTSGQFELGKSGQFELGTTRDLQGAGILSCFPA